MMRRARGNVAVMTVLSRYLAEVRNSGHLHAVWKFDDLVSQTG
jgi:hypothetical protein